MDSIAACETSGSSGLLFVLDAHSPEESWLRAAKKDWMKTSNLAKAGLDPDLDFRFRRIVKMVMEHDQCPQLKYCMENQENVAEPLWRAALSIAWHCSA